MDPCTYYPVSQLKQHYWEWVIFIPRLNRLDICKTLKKITTQLHIIQNIVIEKETLQHRKKICIHISYTIAVSNFLLFLYVLRNNYTWNQSYWNFWYYEYIWWTKRNHIRIKRKIPNQYRNNTVMLLSPPATNL